MKEYDSAEPTEPIVDTQAEVPDGDMTPPEPETPEFKLIHAWAMPLRAQLEGIDADGTISDEQKRHIKRELVLQELGRRGVRYAFSNKTGQKRIP